VTAADEDRISATPRRLRRQLAMSELMLGVAGSFAVTAPGDEAEIAAKYGLSPTDMAKIKEDVGARLERYALRLGYDNHWD
jgi:hypothetical protein